MIRISKNNSFKRLPYIELKFDGVSHCQFIHFTNIDRAYNEIMEDVEKEWESLDEEFDLPCYSDV